MSAASHPQIVFTEIPASDPERASKFYETFLQAPLVKDDSGPNPIWMFPYAEGGHPAGHVYPGKPAPAGVGPTAHFAVIDDLADAMARVRAGGGEVVSEVISIPIGAFFYAHDSEGNSLGVFKFKT